MILRTLAALAVLGFAADALGACPSTTGCPVAPQNGIQPCNEQLARLMERASRNRLYDGGPTLAKIGQGCANSTSVDATVPCVLTKAIAYAESTWRQFCAAACDQSGRTIISFDCGYGLTQVTSGMSGGAGFEPLRVATDAQYNLGAGMKILCDKWRATPCVGDNQPTVLEHWYLATWAYNSFSWRNNPNNPAYPAGRPPFNGPGTLSRGSYPYQEIVWGYIRNPPSSAGKRLWDPVAVSYPKSAEICATDGCRPGALSEPVPTHTDSCQTTVPDLAELASEEPANPIAATASASVVKTWRLRNTGDALWTRAGGYAFVRTSPEVMGAPAKVDLPDAASIRYDQLAELKVTLAPTAAGSKTVTYRLQKGAHAVGPELVATVTVPAGADADGDGHVAGSAGGDDCDDANPKVFPGAAEACNGRDEDCDGEADEALTRPCRSACGDGVERCAAGAFGGCSAPAPVAEVCDGRDQDCNGAVDDGAGCPANEVCVEGTCVAAPSQPQAPAAASVVEVQGGCGCGMAGGAIAPGFAAVLAAGCWLRRRRGSAS